MWNHLQGNMVFFCFVIKLEYTRDCLASSASIDIKQRIRLRMQLLVETGCFERSSLIKFYFLKAWYIHCIGVLSNAIIFVLQNSFYVPKLKVDGEPVDTFFHTNRS